MLDFLKISTRPTKSGLTVYPTFRMYPESKDLMIRGGDFYAVWVEDLGLWSTKENDALALIDRELEKYVEDNSNKFDGIPNILYMYDSDSGMVDSFHRYCQRQMRDTYKMLDEELIFANTEPNKEHYASKKLEYPLEAGSITAYDKLIGTLYTEEERHKLEWAIGSIVSGDSKHIQKFMVLYGEAGTGKSTILNIIQQLFKGYYTIFDAKALGSYNNSFPLEAFKTNPLVAIQHDGDLSRIEDNTILNSLVSHEELVVNEKHKGTYTNRFKCFLFMGTNKPVRITDAKSGLLRRLIDVSPSGKKVSKREYEKLMDRIPFELGAIAQHCLEVYQADPRCYDDYVPLSMMDETNDFYNFIIDSYHVFKREDGTTLKAAWEMYKTYTEEAKVPYPFPKRQFKGELRNYFKKYDAVVEQEDGNNLYEYFSGFITNKLFKDESNGGKKKKEEPTPKTTWLKFEEIESIFDKEYSDCPAQYATDEGTPMRAWAKVKTKLSDLDTSRLHYAKVQENHIVVDFDIKDENGNKSFEKNLEAASKWPETYAELSKSGGGIHLHYIYTGDVSQLSRIYDEDIEIKVFNGGSSLRRKLTKCNNLPIATINSGLPLKGGKTVINFDGLKNEKMLRNLIKRHLNKEIMGYTKPSIDMIYKVLEESYDSGMSYDVTDMRNAIIAFAVSSNNQSDECLRIVNKMKFKSEEASMTRNESDDERLVFYDVEVFPNLFLVNWKFQGEGSPVVRMINPKPSDIEQLIKYKLVGFNCRRYDNHILYGRLNGYDNLQLYNLSQRIINGDRNAFFGEAYNLSYTDVYDFSSKKQSLKKWEIELGIHHQELGLAWDQDVPEHLWTQVAEYCDNDVIATEAVFNARKGDFTARKIQVDLVKLMWKIDNVTVNDTTNTLSTKIIFGNNRKPQSEFNWRDMALPVGSDRYEEYRRKFGEDYRFRVFNADGLPEYRDYIPGETLPKGWSILPFFIDYKFEFGKSTYLGDVIGEGGRVYSDPGMYGGVWDGDITSQHPHSIEAERLFGPRYTRIFYDLVLARVAIKHRDFETAGTLLGGALKPYLKEELADDLAQALKIVINSIYGLTSASFENPFRDFTNVDNIVAKRGALFMTLLKREVEKLGYKVAHIKTDSIKIPDADQRVIDFVTKFGKEFGYSFETEANFEKFCLVNDAVYIAKHLDGKKAGKWTATGTQFAVPYVFKKLFTGEPIEFDDMCETKSVKTAIYLDMNESLPDVSMYEKELEKTESKYKKGQLSDMTFEAACEELNGKIMDGHDYRFIGKVGNFCPIKPGHGGGLLVSSRNGKYNAVTGTKGYRWLEAEQVRESGCADSIDRSYYDRLVDEAVATIAQFGDAEWFMSDDPYISPVKNNDMYDFMNIPIDADEEIPFDEDTLPFII